MLHPCAEEHPWRLADCPAELLAALWEDAVAYESPDAAELFEAWHDLSVEAASQ
jgi:hypothetical protein